MTWARVLATGSGLTRFRLAIAGYPEFVTDKDMEETNNGRARYVGLKAETLRISERASLAEATLDVGGNRVEITDIAGRATRAFSYRARPVAILDEDLSYDATEMVVKSNSLLEVGEQYHIGTETIEVEEPDDVDPNTGATITRSLWDTQPQAHFVEGDRDRSVYVTDAPMSAMGRRATVYGYGEGDSPTGDGTVIWRGVVKYQPKLSADMSTWVVDLDPITALLDQKVGSDLDLPARIRGIYYPWTAPFIFKATELNSGLATGTVAFTSTKFYVTGYYATQDAFTSAVNALIDTACAAFSTYTNGGQIMIRGMSGGELRFSLRAPSSGYKYVWIEAGSAVDGTFSAYPYEENTTDFGGLPSYVIVPGNWNYPQLITTEGPTRSVLGVPRAYFGTVTTVGPGGGEYDGSAQATAPENRLYLSESLGAAVGDAITIGPLASLTGDYSPRFQIASVDSSNNYITTLETWGSTVSGAVEIRAQRNYGTDTSVDGFRDELVDQAVNANLGGTPNITGSDLADWTAVVTAAGASRQLVTSRDYIFPKSKKLSEILAEELKLIGCYLVIDSAGKIAIKQLRISAATESATATIGEAQNLVSAGWPGFDFNVDGIRNAIEIHHGFDPNEDEHTRIPFLVKDRDSIATHSGRMKALKIAPFSQEHGWTLTFEEAADIADNILPFFGRDYRVVSVTVPWTLFDVYLGDTVSMTLSNVPNQDGTRDVSSQLGLVIGREWGLRDAHGTLTVLVHDEPVIGYAPSARIRNDGTTAHSGANLWVIEVEDYFYAEDALDASFFAVGDYVQIYQWHDATPDSQTGVITAINTSLAMPTITVQLDGAAPASFPATGTWNMDFRDAYTGYTPTANQQRYAVIADSTGLLWDGSQAQAFGV